MSRTRAEQLRDDFDASFARPPVLAAQSPERLLCLRVGTEPYAIRLAQVAGLTTIRAITALPSRLPALLGLVGVRSGLVPVYSLGVLLGYPRPAETPRWMVLCASRGDLIGLGFETFEGYVELPPEQVSTAERRASDRHHVFEAARAREQLRGVISIPSVTNAIEETLNHG